MVNKKENTKSGSDDSSSSSDRYTIFHALFEALKDKDKKHKKR